MSSDPIEVLREVYWAGWLNASTWANRDDQLDDRGSEAYKKLEGEAVQPALASLSAPKPRSVNDNAVAVNESAPVNDKPESAEAVGEVLRSGNGVARVAMFNDSLRPGTKVYTAPPRPDAVRRVVELARRHEGHDPQLREALASLEPQQASECGTCEPDGVYDTEGNGPMDCYACGKKATRPTPDLMAACHRLAPWMSAVLGDDEASLPLKAEATAFLEALHAVPQQASAPVGVEDECQLHREAHLRIDSILIGAGVFEVEHEGGTRETWENTIAAVQTLAQHPAAVDEALERLRREGYPRLWNADLVGGQISVERMREILTAALAGQQGGES